MQQEAENHEHHLRRSQWIRELVQRNTNQPFANHTSRGYVPRAIVQFWHDMGRLPVDVEECVGTWASWKNSGFTHRLFDQHSARAFIGRSLGLRYEQAFERCYHPAMQSDYFRLCYLLIEGGFYVDADDVCVTSEINWLFEDGRLKLQPLCYDTATDRMVRPSAFLRLGAHDPSWIFYFNNNPLIAGPDHQIIERALNEATTLLERDEEGGLPEIQATAGPGNISKTVFELGAASKRDVEKDLLVLGDWESVAVSRWPLSYRSDSRNWRLSNQKGYLF